MARLDRSHWAPKMAKSAKIFVASGRIKGFAAFAPAVVDDGRQLTSGCQKANIIYRPEHYSHSLALAEVGGWAMGMCV